MTSDGNRTRIAQTLRTALSRAGLATFTAGVVAFAFSPFAVIVIPGVLGGLIASVLIWRRGRHASPPEQMRDVFGSDVRSSDVINFASIRVAGVGGLGLVIVALAVGLQFQRVGIALAMGLVGGSLAAMFMILRRRRTGLSDDHGDPGARAMLPAGEDDATAAKAARGSGDDERHAQRRSPQALAPGTPSMRV
jgi:hypothetical protein